MKYDYGKIEDYCNQINNINIDMKKQFDLILSIINNVDSSWTGKASEYYINQAKLFSGKFDDFYRELNACTLYLKKCSDSYNQLDKKVKQEINEILSESKIFN